MKMCWVDKPANTFKLLPNRTRIRQILWFTLSSYRDRRNNTTWFPNFLKAYDNCRWKITPISGSETKLVISENFRVPNLESNHRCRTSRKVKAWALVSERTESNLRLYCDCIFREPTELATNTFSASKIRHVRSNPERARLINHPRRAHALTSLMRGRCKSRDTGCPSAECELWRIQRPTSLLGLARPRSWWVHYHIPSSFVSTNFEDQGKRSTHDRQWHRYYLHDHYDFKSGQGINCSV